VLSNCFSAFQHVDGKAGVGPYSFLSWLLPISLSAFLPERNALLSHTVTQCGGVDLQNLGGTILPPHLAIRQFDQEAEEPLSRHALFIRSFWQDALVYKLDITGIFQMNLEDKSFFIQPLAAYHLGDRTTLSLAFNFFLGAGESEYGSLPQLWNVRAGIQYFF
jgi:hypothetical protein